MSVPATARYVPVWSKHTDCTCWGSKQIGVEIKLNWAWFLRLYVHNSILQKVYSGKLCSYNTMCHRNMKFWGKPCVI